MPTASSRPHVVPPAGASARLIDYAREHLVCVASDELADLITGGDLLCNGAPATHIVPLRAGDRLLLRDEAIAGLRASRRWAAPFARELDVVHEDADIIVVNKPSGMHVHPLGKYRDEALTNALMFRAGARATNPWAEWRPHPAHRLDRPASGLVVIAKSGAIRDCLRRLLDGRHVSRTYLARVTGEVSGASGTIDTPLGRDPTDDYRRAVRPVENGGQKAVTHWTVRERGAGWTLLELTLDTGRTHQIRAHLASIGHAIEGDTLYLGGPKSPNAAAIRLHAAALTLPHPRRGGPLHFTSTPTWGDATESRITET